VPPSEAGRLVGARPLGADLPPPVARLVQGRGR
jgi:allantoicase